MQWRTIFIIFIFGLAYSLLVFNIYDLQIAKRAYYLALAQTRDSFGGVLSAPRGNIYFTDKNGNKIQAVLDKDYPTIFAVPSEIQKQSSSEEEIKKNIEVMSEKLSGIIGKPTEDIAAQLSKKNDEYELLLQKASADQMAQIQEINLKGIYIRNQSLRYYPSGDLASQVLGFVSPANEKESQSYGNAELGRYGIELYFNKQLSGTPGQLKNNYLIESQKGGEIVLTIDRNIQSQAEDILRNLIKQYGAKGGSVIIEEPSTGKIMAMTSMPDFDPNNYPKYSLDTFSNPAVEGRYEPGSVFKPITMAAGIDSGKITPDTKYFDNGSFTANGKTIKNWDYDKHGPYGWATMTNVLEHSINTGAVFTERTMGPEIFRNYLIKFGLNQSTKITLPGEIKGNLNNLVHGRDIDFATAAYGQGVAVTPIELINAISVIANGGVLMKPWITVDTEPQIVQRVISKDTSRKVTQMMVSAVEVNRIAAIPGYNIAGKTGTAFVPDFGRKRYTDKVINTYVGYTPAFNPKFVILIKLNEPTGSPLAGETVVPAFHDLAQFIINYLNIPPDKL